MFTMFAAMTAANGTNRPIRGGRRCKYVRVMVGCMYVCVSTEGYTFCTNLFRMRAVVVAAVVAATQFRMRIL